jgi:hypothetical protein
VELRFHDRICNFDDKSDVSGVKADHVCSSPIPRWPVSNLSRIAGSSIKRPRESQSVHYERLPRSFGEFSARVAGCSAGQFPIDDRARLPLSITGQTQPFFHAGHSEFRQGNQFTGSFHLFKIIPRLSTTTAEHLPSTGLRIPPIQDNLVLVHNHREAFSKH